MKKILLITISFVLLCIAFVILFVLFAPKEIKSPIVEGLSISCKNLPESACLLKNNCRANYGPSSCSGQMCTADIIFKNCNSLTIEESDQIQKDKTLCTNSEGKWIDDRYSHPGRCECSSSSSTSYFRANEGCMSQEMDCQKYNGQLYQPNELLCTEEVRTANPSNCPKETQYNLFETCICQNGKAWNYIDRCN